MKLTAKIHQKRQKLAFLWSLHSRQFHGHGLKTGNDLKNSVCYNITLHHYNITSHLPSMEALMEAEKGISAPAFCGSAICGDVIPQNAGPQFMEIQPP